MHRLKSDMNFLTGYDFYHNEDLELKNYKGKRESSWNEGKMSIIPFGKYKGVHITKVKNEYLNWILENFDNGSIKDMFQAEKERRNNNK